MQKILMEIRRRGLSEQEAINLATVYDLSRLQICAIRQRILAVDSADSA